MAKAAKQPTFEDMMSRMEAIVDAMEKGAMPLEESLKSFEEAMDLSKKMEDLLKKGQARVMELTRDGAEKPFDREDVQ